MAGKEYEKTSFKNFKQIRCINEGKNKTVELATL